MEPVLKVTFAVAAAVALGGCVSTDRLTANYQDARRAVGLEAAAARPASQLSLIMQRRLAALPDPTRPDHTQAGLPGQVFLVGADGKPTTVTGDLVVTVSDETSRPAGQSPKITEKWHFTPDVLGKLKVKDDRFGECFVLFLPWPAEWADVGRVKVRANYKAAGQVELFSTEVIINLDALTKGEAEEKFEKLAASKSAAGSAVAGQPPIPITPPLPASPPVIPVQPSVPMVLPQPAPFPAAPTGPVEPQTIVVPRS